ncbi:hypothetical protein OG920_41000 [Streptomyces europaeiscabiei]
MHLTGRSAVAYKEMVSGSPLTTYRFSKRMNVTTNISRDGRRIGAPATR